nr:helix-turn-helix transcriptional regulator [uncultured Anaerosporobacter sp.]
MVQCLTTKKNITKYKINILQLLKDLGYTTYKLRKDKLLAESTIQKLRNNEPISWDNIETLCKLLNCQPGDIMKYEKENE